MTSPFDRSLPPLTGLPSPPRLPEENPSLVPPAEIMAESRAAITRRLLRIVWMPALVLIGLWLTLLFLYIAGASPTFWLLSLLVGLFEPMYLSGAVRSLGFSSSGLWAAVLLLPVLATGLSVALLPLASRVISGIDPRRLLSEADFQRQVATRITAVLMAPPLLIVALLTLLVAQPIGQVPGLHWPSLSAGPLTALCAGLLSIMLAWVWIRSWVSAVRVLQVTPLPALLTTARLDRDHDKRHVAAARVLAQDRRHLPPTPGSTEEHGARSPRGLLTALRVSARAWLTWVAPTMLALGVIVFGIADVVAVIMGMGQDLQAVESAPLSLPAVAGFLTVLLFTALAAALAPAVAIELSRGQKAQVSDQRSYPEWAHRARVNPWEARVVGLSGWITAAAALASLAAVAGLLQLLGAATALLWTWLVLGALVAVPLVGLGTAAGLREDLRDVIYGPAGLYMRRETPHALVAPDLGTRADRGRDPAVRAHLRQRLQAQGGDHQLEIFDLDAAGERLWIDESLPGARTTEVRAADVAAGRLPDFGGQGSPFQAPHQGYGRRDHDIPDSVPGLREP